MKTDGKFENDVKIYGIKTLLRLLPLLYLFENDVKIYGIKTFLPVGHNLRPFENDVKIYGIKTKADCNRRLMCLRMM